MVEKDHFIKRVVSAPRKRSEAGIGNPSTKDGNGLVLSEAQIAFSESQTPQFLAPANRVFRYRNHEDMTRDMESWIVKTIVHVQKTRDREKS